ncbi:hypothetical protein ACS0TY_015243 [Phlomoides rotata]
MNGEGSAENTLEFGGKYFGESAREEEEEERGAENGTGNKRIKEMPIDRFGELPDSLLIHTLSFLTVKEAAITSVLSKRWEFLWAQLPSLEFRADSGAIEKVRNFVSWVNRTLAIRTVRSLENLDGFTWHTSFVEVMNGASELLESVQHVKELHVGLEFIKVVAMMALIDWQFPQSRRELLIVAFDSEYEHSISGIISLLESSPNLQTLVIDRCSADGEDVIFQLEEDELTSDLLHLKTIRIRNFADSECESVLTLARILLKRATVLEEMVIMTDVKDLSDFAEMVQTLLTYPRASTKAVVRLVK